MNPSAVSAADQVLLDHLHSQAARLPDPGHGWRYHCHEALMLVFGRLFTPRPWNPAVPKDRPKDCFANAVRLAAADPTWPDELCHSDVGLPLARWFVRARMVATGQPGVLAGDWHDDFWLLRHGLPDQAVLDLGRRLPARTGQALR